MAAVTPTSIAQAGSTTGTTPVPITPTASDTIAGTLIGPNGLILRVITTGTATNVTVVDPGATPMGSLGNPGVLAAPATGTRSIRIPITAINSSGQVTVTFSGALTGVTYELYQG